jgi:TetR/AcrR family transcriptional regulator, regulator of autoinduction and epiphytic fitness
MGAGGTDGAKARGYRSPRRENQARQTRARIIAAAARRFLAHGYSRTTMRAVALDAGVALPTVELAFRTKAGLLKAVIDVATAGDDEHAAMLEREWAAQAQSIAEAADLIAAFARVLTESAERAAGLAAAALEAARADEDIAEVAAQLMTQRGVMAAWLVDGIILRSPLREGTSRADAVDTVWTLMDPVIFRRLTENRHWLPTQFERWFTDSVTRLLLTHRPLRAAAPAESSIDHAP